MRPLSRQEFAEALKKGHGRALRHVIQVGIGEYKDLVLDACIHSKNYDPQIDPSRAPWLYSMIRNTPYYEEFRDVILSTIDSSESKDFFAMGSLLNEMTATGDTFARQKLKEIAFENAKTGSEDEDIIHHWVDFQSVDEFIELARILGSRLQKDPDAEPFDSILPEGRNQEFKDILYHQAQADPSIQKYWEYLVQREQNRNANRNADLDAEKKARHEQIRKKYPLEQILKDASEKKGKLPGCYMTFGRHATKEDLEFVYTSIFQEIDPDVQMRLLWVFRGTQLPTLHDLLFQWSSSEHDGLRAAVIAALANTKDERVHQLAIGKIKRAEILGSDQEIIGLFHKNYDQADAGLITTALHAVEPSDEDAHELGYDLIELSEIVADSGLSDALEWVYEYTPCTFCRYKAVKQLIEFNSIDEQIALELPFDANEDIRELAEKNLRSDDSIQNS